MIKAPDGFPAIQDDRYVAELHEYRGLKGVGYSWRPEIGFYRNNRLLVPVDMFLHESPRRMSSGGISANCAFTLGAGRGLLNEEFDKRKLSVNLFRGLDSSGLEPNQYARLGLLSAVAPGIDGLDGTARYNVVVAVASRLAAVIPEGSQWNGVLARYATGLESMEDRAFVGGQRKNLQSRSAQSFSRTCVSLIDDLRNPLDGLNGYYQGIPRLGSAMRLLPAPVRKRLAENLIVFAEEIAIESSDGKLERL